MRRRDETYVERLERTVFTPTTTASRTYWLVVAVLAAIVLWGVYAYIVQLRYGLIATGMRDQVFYGLYLVNFVFFIGISHAGTLISAILRVTNAGWRTPITRMAEMITVVAISIGGIMPILDMGRPDRVWHMVTWGRFQSALLWDIVSIASYLTGSIIYLYLPLVPDFARMRDRLGRNASVFRKQLYTVLALGWRNTLEQRHRLERGIGIMAVTIIPIAVSVHTVVAYVFSMTLRPGWNSTAFGIYFVIGAIFSGIASIIIVMAVFRKLYHFEEYITERHFRNLGLLLLTALLAYLYLTIGEFLTVGYKLETEEMHLLELISTGSNALWFWGFVVFSLVIPGTMILLKIGKTISRLVIAAIMINIGMWLKRFIIVIPSIQVPLMPFEFGAYAPTWVEWSITVGAFAMLMLIFAVVSKFMPLISYWEVAEEVEARSGRQTVAEAELVAPGARGQ